MWRQRFSTTLDHVHGVVRYESVTDAIMYLLDVIGWAAAKRHENSVLKSLRKSSSSTGTKASPSITSAFRLHVTLTLESSPDRESVPSSCSHGGQGSYSHVSCVVAMHCLAVGFTLGLKCGVSGARFLCDLRRQEVLPTVL